MYTHTHTYNVLCCAWLSVCTWIYEKKKKQNQILLVCVHFQMIRWDCGCSCGYFWLKCSQCMFIFYLFTWIKMYTTYTTHTIHHIHTHTGYINIFHFLFFIQFLILFLFIYLFRVFSVRLPIQWMLILKYFELIFEYFIFNGRIIIIMAGIQFFSLSFCKSWYWS